MWEGLGAGHGAIVHSHPVDALETAEPAPFRLRMDAVPDSVVWGRSFAASLAAAHGADLGSVADLRIAASEIIARIVSCIESGTDESVVIEMRPEADRLIFEFSPWDADHGDRASESFDPWDVVSVLFEEATEGDASVMVPVDLDTVS